MKKEARALPLASKQRDFTAHLSVSVPRKTPSLRTCSAKPRVLAYSPGRHLKCRRLRQIHFFHRRSLSSSGIDDLDPLQRCLAGSRFPLDHLPGSLHLLRSLPQLSSGSSNTSGISRRTTILPYRPDLPNAFPYKKIQGLAGSLSLKNAEAKERAARGSADAEVCRVGRGGIWKMEKPRGYL